MRKYIKPSIEVVELSVKESLSAIPFHNVLKKSTTAGGKTASTITIYKKTSIVNNG